MYKVICDICGKEITKCNYNRHLNSHKNFKKDSYHLDHDDLFCKFCGKECKNKNSLAQHEIRCKENPDKLYVINKRYPIIYRPAWNKGLTKDSNESMKKVSESIKNIININGHLGCFGLKGKDNFSTKEEVRCKISRTAKLNHSINENLKVGKGKRGWYKGIYCQSSWELAYVIFQLEHNVNIIRNKKGFKYIWNGSEHTYFPDFYLPDIDQYVEIKGYYSDRDKCKVNQFTEKLIVLEKKHLEYILNYVINFYGEDYVKLYE